MDSIKDQINQIKHAIEIASHITIPEVCIFNELELLRANRVTIVDDKLYSPNYPALGKLVDGQFQADWKQVIFSQSSIQKFNFQEELSDKIYLLQLNPEINYDKLGEIICPSILDGLVIMSYASGTLPINNEKFIKLIKGFLETKIAIKVSQAS